jgi:integrase
MNKMRQKIHYKQKYAMSEQEIEDYLREQSVLNKEYYCIQLLLLKYGLRVSSVALLKRGQLEFLDSRRKQVINFFDVKNKKEIPREVDDEISRAIRLFIADKGDVENDQYFFMRSAKNLRENRRANEMSKEINKFIKLSKVLVKNPNYTYSSHMFRRTLAQSIYNEGVKEAKEKVRSALAQVQNSQAVEHYISNEN